MKVLLIGSLLQEHEKRDNDIFDRLHLSLDRKYQITTVKIGIRTRSLKDMFSSSRNSKGKPSERGGVSDIRWVRVYAAMRYDILRVVSSVVVWVYIACRKAIIREIRGVDIVHAIGVFPAGFVALALKKRYGIKYVVNIRNESSIILRNRIYAAGAVINSAECVVTPMVSVKHAVKRCCGKVCKVIPHGVDVEYRMLQNNRYVNPSSSMKIVTVSRYLPVKGLPWHIKAFDEIISRCNIDIEYTLVGDGEWRKDVFEAYEACRNKKSINLVGWQESVELARIYQSSDVFVLISERETFGLVYAEALMSGCTVIATKASGFYDIERENKWVYGVEFGNANELFRVVMHLYENLDILRGNRPVIAQTSKKYNWDSMVDTYKSVLSLQSQ